MSPQFDYVVIDGGLAGASAVETLRSEGATGSILLLSEEAQLPYQRPPLSKGFLTSEKKPTPSLIVSEAKYKELDVETSELVMFDSYTEDLSADHIVASGSLPPSFPWTTINGKHYWNGGIVSNSPLEKVVERCGSAGKRVFIIDLFPGK